MRRPVTPALGGPLLVLLLACGGLGTSHPAPSRYDVDITGDVDTLIQQTGLLPTKLASSQLEQDLVDEVNRYFRKEKAKRRHFAVAIHNQTYTIERSRGVPARRTVCGLYFWLDEQGLCHGSSYELAQSFDGLAYDETWRYHDRCWFNFDAPGRVFKAPQTLHEPGAKATSDAMYYQPGLLFEACSDTAAYRAHLTAYE